jgi:hypothetical protein
MSRAEHCISRPAYRAPCNRCGERVIIGIDAGLTIRASTVALSVHAEIAAILAGRPVYDIDRLGGKTWLIHRDIYRTRRPRVNTVVTDHACPDGKRCLMPWDIPPDRPAYAKPPVQFNPEEKVPF